MKIIRFIIIGLIFFNNAFSQTFEKTINDNLFNPVFPGRNIQVTANEDYLVAGKTEPVNGYNKIILTKFLSSVEKLWTKVYKNGEYVNYHISLEKSQDGGYIISASVPHEVRIIKIYPNPVYGQSIVEFSNPDKKRYDCFVYDISGRVLRYYSNITESSFVFQKEDLVNGIYFIELRGTEIIRGRIIIE